jgi:hypothetical protein
MRKVLFPVLLGAVTIVLTALFLEVAVRLVVDDGMQFDLEMWKYARDVKVVSENPTIGHEHGANRKAALMGVDVETSAQGLRDRAFSPEPKPGVPRILMIGDSLTFGWGVPYEATFSKRIERLLPMTARRSRSSIPASATGTQFRRSPTSSRRPRTSSRTSSFSIIS